MTCTAGQRKEEVEKRELQKGRGKPSVSRSAGMLNWLSFIRVFVLVLPFITDILSESQNVEEIGEMDAKSCYLINSLRKYMCLCLIVMCEDVKTCISRQKAP